MSDDHIWYHSHIYRLGNPLCNAIMRIAGSHNSNGHDRPRSPEDSHANHKPFKVGETGRLRSLAHLINLMENLKARDIGFRSLTENLDTGTAGCQLIFSIFGAISQSERDLIRERTRAGLDAARRRGRVGGRPRSMTDEKLDAAKKLLAAGTPPKDVAESLSVSIPTIYRWLPAAAR